jgi:hypothetical protein
MKNRNTRRYAVKMSRAPYATVISSHCTLPQAYRSFVKHHKKQFRLHRFPMAQESIAIIASEAPTEIIRADIAAWANADVGPPSKQRLPLPIVVHQWNPRYQTYLRFGLVT